MTNMMFTKGVGCLCMAPEVLNNRRYENPSDTCSSGVRLYLCFLWGEAYQKTLFTCPWLISFIDSWKTLWEALWDA